MKNLFIGVMCILGLGMAKTVDAQWTWQGEIFEKGFSPRWYYSGYWDYGVWQYFGGCMWWDQSGSDHIFDLSQSGFRYTHDITDLNNNLGYSGWYVTNFPRPKFDTDDDEGDGIKEETEVTALDAAFPVPYPIKKDCYYFIVEMRRGGAGPLTTGGGTVDHTPAISLWVGEWQTFDYERSPYHGQYVPFFVSSSQSLAKKQSADIKRGNEQQRARGGHILFNQPQTIARCQALAEAASAKISAFQLEYRVTRESGEEDTAMVHGQADENNNTISLERAQRLVDLIPSLIQSRMVGIHRCDFVAK